MFWGEAVGKFEGGGTHRHMLPLHSDMLPDLEDSATPGCLLVLVREAWGDLTAFVCCVGGWSVVVRNGVCDRQTIGPFATEAACLVAALESAP